MNRSTAWAPGVAKLDPPCTFSNTSISICGRRRWGWAGCSRSQSWGYLAGTETQLLSWFCCHPPVNPVLRNLAFGEADASKQSQCKPEAFKHTSHWQGIKCTDGIRQGQCSSDLMDEIENTGIQVCAPVIESWGKQGVSDGALEEGGEWRESEKEEGGEEGGMQLNCCGCTASQLSSQAGIVAHPPPMLYECTGTSKERQSRLLEIPTENEKGWRQRAKSCGGPPLTRLCDKAFCYSACYCCFVSKYRICQIMMVRHHHPGAIWMTPTPPSSPTLELPVWSRHNIFSLCPNHLFPILFDNSLIVLPITWTSYMYMHQKRYTTHLLRMRRWKHFLKMKEAVLFCFVFICSSSFYC